MQGLVLFRVSLLTSSNNNNSLICTPHHTSCAVPLNVLPRASGLASAFPYNQSLLTLGGGNEHIFCSAQVKAPLYPRTIGNFIFNQSAGWMICKEEFMLKEMRHNRPVSNKFYVIY